VPVSRIILQQKPPNMNIFAFLKERWHLIAVFILGIGIVVACIVFGVYFQNSNMSISGMFNINQDEPKKTMYLVGISQVEVPPFLTYDQDVEIGLDVDLIQWISNDVEINITFVRMATFETGLDALRYEEIDMLLSGISITPKRMEEFLFSDPYMSTEQQIAVAGESTLTLNDFYAGPGLIGVKRGTTSYETVRNLFIDPLRVHEINGVVQVAKELVNGKIDFMVTEQPIIATLAQEYPLKVIGSISTGEEYGIMFRKDNVSLQKMINASLKKLLNSPEWNTIKYKYYPEQLQ